MNSSKGRRRILHDTSALSHLILGKRSILGVLVNELSLLRPSFCLPRLAVEGLLIATYFTLAGQIHVGKPRFASIRDIRQMTGAFMVPAPCSKPQILQ